MKPLYRIPGIIGLRNLIKAVCECHPAVKEFKSGINLSETTDNTYPLAFLESDMSSDTVGPKESFTVSLSLAETVSKDATEEEYILAMSKIDQVLSEIHFELTQISSIITVGDSFRKLHYRDQDSDRLAVVRSEFEITIPRHTAKRDTPLDKIKLQVFLNTLTEQ